jgi:hypothetical protein
LYECNARNFVDVHTSLNLHQRDIHMPRIKILTLYTSSSCWYICGIVKDKGSIHFIISPKKIKLCKIKGFLFEIVGEVSRTNLMI